MDALQQCTQLVELRMVAHQLNESHLAAILSAMPHLEKLDLYLPNVTSLHFLAQPSARR